LECLANNIIPTTTSMTGNNGISMVNGIINIEKIPVRIPKGIIKTTVRIIEINRKIILKGILNI
jgi:hypothetical protein